MDKWTKNQLDLIVASSLTSLRDAYVYSEIWISFFECQDKNVEFQIDKLFQKFVRYAIGSIVLDMLGEYDPCDELDWENGTKNPILLPIERFMKNLTCLESPFAEDIADMECQSDCEDYLSEYMAFISDSECFEKLVDRISDEVFTRSPFKLLFEEKARAWKYSLH